MQVSEFTISLKMKQRPSELKMCKTSFDMAEVCRECINADNIDWFETMIVIGLNRSNKVLGFYKISQGGITGTVCDPRIILQFALLSNSCSIVLCHNHPSGSSKPSQADEELTQKIKLAASYHDIKLLDHLILTSESYFSFLDEGLL